MIINAKIKTKQREFCIEKKSENDWIISVKSAPELNRANQEIIRELGKKYKKVKILRGLKSHRKTIFLE